MAKNQAPQNEDPMNLPAVSETDLLDVGFPAGIKMAPGLALFMNDRIYKRCRAVSIDLSTADSVMPGHLLNKPAAIFAVMSLSITWNLSPILVARCTYQTPGGGIGFMGVLIQAILENSGRIDGEVKFKMIGDWPKLRGRFKMQKGDRGKDYAVADWKPEDEIGLGVEVVAQIRGEPAPLSETFYLNEFHPRFSTLWATRPWQQIRYTAVRAFANIACPGILMGLPFDVDPESFYGDSMPMTDVTPKQQKNEFARPSQSQEGKRPEPGPQADDKKVATKTETKPVEEKKPEPQKEPEPPPVEEKKPEPPPPTENEQLEREAAQADRAALQGQEQAQPAVQEDQQRPTEAERKARHDDELRDWYSDMKKLIPTCRFVRDVTELRESVMPNIEGDMAKEFSKLCDERQTAILEATRPGAKRKS